MAAAPTTTEEPQLPVSSDEMSSQAADAVLRAWENGEGLLRHRIDLILPINEKKYDFQAIESMDYPCSLTEEFEVAVDLAENVAEMISGQPRESFRKRRLDAGGVEGDPCMLIETPEGIADRPAVSVVAFPFADNLQQIQKLVENEAKGENGRLVVLLNPQWKNSGQIVSDFGFGPWKRKADEFLNTFKNTYTLSELRIGAPSSLSLQDGKRYSDGGVVRVVRSYPGPHLAFVMAVDGASQAIATFEEGSFPSYGELDQAIKDGRNKNLEIFNYAKDAVMPNPFAASKLSEESSAVEDFGSLVQSMDKTSVRQALEKRGLPTSGGIATIRNRLKDVLEREGTASPSA